MSDVLIDTSAWVVFFAGDRKAVARIDPLLADGRTAICGPIYAEVISGCGDRMVLDRLKVLLRSLPWLPEPPDVWDLVSEARFSLARSGVQAAATDVLIAVTASKAGHRLLTRDRDFLPIRRAVPLDVDLL